MSESRKRCTNCIHHNNRGNRGIWCKKHLHYVYSSTAILCNYYEKRFTLDMTNPFIRCECIFDYEQDKFIEKIEEVVDLLNKQDLRIKELENLKEYKQLKQDNEKLKKQLNKIPPKIREIWE